MPRAASGRRRNQFVTFEVLSESVTADAAGQIDESDEASWESSFDTWAQVIAKGSREFFGAAQVQANVTHQINVAYSSETATLTTEQRIRHGEKTYNIAGPPIDPDGKQAELFINAIEVP